MSEWKPEIVRLGPVLPHPNAGSLDPKLRCDTLSLTMVHGGYPVMFRTGEFKEGDLAAYIPIETMIPSARPEFAFLEGHERIRAKRLRGCFSMGLLVAAPLGFEEGTSVVDHFGLEPYTPAEERRRSATGTAIPGPVGWEFPRYTDIEGLRRYKDVLQIAEEVVILEKVHGQNARFCWDGTELWVGSRTTFKEKDSKVNWWEVANKLKLKEKLSKFPDIAFYGELYGKSVQDLTYGLTEKSLLIFDTFNTRTMTYNTWDVTKRLAEEAGLQVVPELYRGEWKGFDFHAPLAEGKSTLADHVREGFVVKPIHERWEHRCGRVIFKLIGEGYQLRDDKKGKR